MTTSSIYKKGTHDWIPEIIEQMIPIIPKNSVFVKLLTINSCATFEHPYKNAPESERKSPTSSFLAKMKNLH